MPLLSPRARFLQNDKLTSTHYAIAHSAEFQAACDAAFQQYAYAAPMTTDAAVASSSAQRLIGAREFIGFLLTLADPLEKAPERTPVGQLNHNA